MTLPSFPSWMLNWEIIFSQLHPLQPYSLPWYIFLRSGLLAAPSEVSFSRLNRQKKYQWQDLTRYQSVVWTTSPLNRTRRWLLTLLNFCTSHPKLKVLFNLSYVRLSRIFCPIRRGIVVTHALLSDWELVPHILHAWESGQYKQRPVSVDPILEDQWNLTAV